MHAFSGVQAAPKWKHVPAPPAWHVKYAATPAWNTQVGFRQPMSFTTEGPLGAGGVAGFVATGPVALPLVGCFGAGGVVHATHATMKISGRTPRL